MNQLTFPELKEEKKKSKSDRAVVLTERDLHIIEFILDMKFSTVQDVFEKFFRITLLGHESNSRHADLPGLNRSRFCDMIWAKKGPNHGPKEIYT